MWGLENDHIWHQNDVSHKYKYQLILNIHQLILKYGCFKAFYALIRLLGSYVNIFSNKSSAYYGIFLIIPLKSCFFHFGNLGLDYWRSLNSGHSYNTGVPIISNTLNICYISVPSPRNSGLFKNSSANIQPTPQISTDWS